MYCENGNVLTYGSKDHNGAITQGVYSTPYTAMTHSAIQEHLGGKVINWLEKMRDDQHDGGASREMEKHDVR